MYQHSDVTHLRCTLLNKKNLFWIMSRDDYFLKVCNNKKAFSVHVLIVFTIICFVVDEKLKLKVLACSFEINN
jgi:hypothetical protein